MKLLNLLNTVVDLPVTANIVSPDNIPDGGYSFADQLYKWCSENSTMLFILCGIVAIGISVLIIKKIKRNRAKRNKDIKDEE